MARPRRLPQFDYKGVQRYFLTVCTLNRVPHFTDAAVVKLVVDQILRIAAQEAIAIPVYLLMPAADLKVFVKLAKQCSGYEFKKYCGKRLWQKGYYEHVLRDAEKTEEVIEYIVSNPVRGKLVENPGDYPYWGSTVYTREEILDFIGWASHRNKQPWRE
jgi:putative transposase